MTTALRPARAGAFLYYRLCCRGTNLENKVILLVDDEPLVRMILAETLSEAGSTVIEADSADVAVEILSRRRDITNVITDVRLPGKLDGISLAQLVGAHWSHISLTLMSGNAIPSEAQLPANVRFLHKPFASEALSRALRT